MPTVKEGASAFLASKRIAVTGVSRKPQRHGGDAVYKRLRERGYQVFVVNPAEGGSKVTMRIWPFFSADELRPCARQAGPMPERVASLICGPASLPWGWRRSAGPPSRLQGAGRARSFAFPLGMADWNGQWYLVPMLGEKCNWVQNVRAADERAVLRHRRAIVCRLVEVPVSQ